MKLWVFDLDGTLVDSFQPFMHFVESKIQRSLREEEKKVIVGLHPTDTFKLYFSEADAVTYWQELVQRDRSQEQPVHLFDGMYDLLQFLKKQNRTVAVWTNRDRESAERVLQTTGLRDFIDKLVSSDCVSARKPHPEGMDLLKTHFDVSSREILMIGDHNHDMEAARQSQVAAVRASWHGHWIDERCLQSRQQFDCSKKFSDWSRQSLLLTTEFQ